MLFGLYVLCTFLVFWQFLGYPLCMALIYIRSKRPSSDKDYSYQPFITIIVPAYNEEKLIERRIENLLSLDYPKDRIEIIVVSSGSTDNTSKIAGNFEGNSSNIIVLDEGARKGKASAINFGKSYARGEVILVTDANTIFSANALKEMVTHLKYPEIGAVGGRFVLSNVDSDLVHASSYYWEIESLMRRGESALDSACLFHGEINAWRKDIIDADTASLAEDLDMAIGIRRQGCKIAYEPDAVAYEAGPTSKREQIVQKKRAVIGTIQSFFKHKRYLWLPGDRYSAFIFPSHKTLQIFSPFLLLGSLVLFITLLVSANFIVPLAYSLAYLVLSLFSLILLNWQLSRIRVSDDDKISKTVLHNVFNILSYVVLHEYIILLAWKDFVLKNYSVKWQKVESTR